MTSFAHNLRSLLAVVSLLLACSTSAFAQREEGDATRAASARALFSDGVKFADRGQWNEAADRFRRALALHDSPVIAYNLASALKELDKLVEASEILQRIAANPEADAELRKSARATLAEIMPRIARVTVHADGMNPGDAILIDEQPLLDAQLDVAIPIDPGIHVVDVRRSASLLETRQVQIEPGGSTEIGFELARAPSPAEVAAAAPIATPSPTREPEADRPLTERWWFWTGVGAVAVGVVIGAVLIASSGGSSKQQPLPGTFDPHVLHVEVAQ